MSDEKDRDDCNRARVCAAAATAIGASPAALAALSDAYQPHERVRLVDALGKPLRLASLATGESYVFNYPYATTPCFLLQLGRPVPGGESLTTGDGRNYRWPGGVGPHRSVVSFCGICTHKLSHPSRSVSFINYRDQKVHFLDKRKHDTVRAGVIYCCSEGSVYDPADGARVLGGPAPQPLAAIALEHDPADDALYAMGTWGQEIYERFFEKNAFRLSLEYGVRNPRAVVGPTSRVLPISEYSRSQIMCG